MNKGVRHFMSKDRKKNHLIVICPTEKEDVKEDVKKRNKKDDQKVRPSFGRQCFI